MIVNAYAFRMNPQVAIQWIEEVLQGSSTGCVDIEIKRHIPSDEPQPLTEEQLLLLRSMNDPLINSTLDELSKEKTDGVITLERSNP